MQVLDRRADTALFIARRDHDGDALERIGGGNFGWREFGGHQAPAMFSQSG